jgi:hypothetical protein
MGEENEELKVWLHIYPGDIDVHLVRINNALKLAFPNEKILFQKKVIDGT